jgi:hypothetical protein
MRALTLALLVLTACSTVTPMQTASVVDPGHLRVGGQLSATGACDLPAGVLGYIGCSDHPDGVPLPELRINGRYGFARRFDVGLSMQGQGTLFAPEKPFQLGLTADVKGELLRIPTSGPTHLISVGVLGGSAIAGRVSLPLWAQFEWGVPVFYGLQFQHLELVASATLSQRFTQSPNLSPSTNTARLGFSLGVYKRDPAGIGVQVSYLTDPTRFSTGMLQLQVGLFFDVK